MKTKYDVGEKVMVEATVHEIKITRVGRIKYLLQNPLWYSNTLFEEEDILPISQNKEEIRADVIDETYEKIITEIAMLNEHGLTEENLISFAHRIKEIAEYLKEQNK